MFVNISTTEILGHLMIRWPSQTTPEKRGQ
jgi:hypothetical protein